MLAVKTAAPRAAFAAKSATRSPLAYTASRAASTSSAPQPTLEPRLPRNLLSMADLSPTQIQNVLSHAAALKSASKAPRQPGQLPLEQTLAGKTIAIMFSKRSTRTRVATETSVASLGGQPMFLGPSDIQLGVNESLYDTSKVIGSMADGIMARVGKHEEVEVSERVRDPSRALD